MTLRHLAPAATVVLTLIAGACGDGGSPQAAPAASSTSAAVTTTEATTTSTTTTTTTTTTTSTTTTSTTTTAPPAQCPGDGALPSPIEGATLAGADVDGDGDVDTVHGYRFQGTWQLQVSFTGGGGSVLVVDDPSADVAGLIPFDGFDVNGNGREEFFARTGAGAAGPVYGLFEVVDCELRAITLAGEPLQLSATATVGTVSGFECIDIDGNAANDFIVIYSGTLLGDTGDYEVTAAQYAILDGEAQFILADGLGANVDDADFSRYASAGCPSITM